MKICLIGPTYPFRGGISHYTTLLYRHLRYCHKVVFFSFKRQYPRLLFPGRTDIDPSQKRLQEPGVRRILDSMNPITWLSVARKIIKTNPDVLIIPWWVSFWAPQFWTISLLIKLFSHTKVVFLCHNVVEHESNRMGKILTRLVLKNGDFFIVHSKEDMNNLLSLLPGAKVKKTFHPTYAVFNTGQFDPQIIKKRYDIQENVILFFGFVREYKGLDYLIKALPKVLSEINASLLIVGEFWRDKNKYLRLIDDLGLKDSVVIIDDYVPNEDVGLYFSAADLIVQPYVSATGSGIIQLAFGFNKPVIATKVGSLPELIKDGKTGYLVQPCSSSEISEAVIKFFRNKDSDRFIKNIKRENHKFSWDRMVDLIEELVLSEKLR